MKRFFPSTTCVPVSLAVLAVGLFVLLSLPIPALGAQSAVCGVVDAIDFPIDINDTLSQGYDDFALYRRRFGGNHVGIDIGFNRWGEPVRAAARGRVTYANPEGWDTEKGVVIVEHTFPDGSIAYTLYGHMEQSETLRFPAVGVCVERGDLLGGIGWPSRGLPHLHYEIRSFLPDDGGPGYVTGSPLLEGWYHPLDFTRLWRLRLNGGVLASVTFDAAPTVPPVWLDSGMITAAQGDLLIGLRGADSLPLWRVSAGSPIAGLDALPGGRVAGYTHEGQVLLLGGGRFEAVWSVGGPDASFVRLGERMVFVTEDGGLAAYEPDGTLVWRLAGDGVAERVTLFEAGVNSLAVGMRVDGGFRLWLVDAAGTLIYESAGDRPPVAAPSSGGSWLVLDGANLDRIANGERTTIATLGMTAGRSARLTSDVLGGAYIYLGDIETTLLAVSPEGTVRWRTRYPYPLSAVPPLLDTGSGCILYTLDSDGMLNLFNTADGALVHQAQLYAGGRYHNARARLLEADAADRVQVGAGYLSVVTFDGVALGGAAARCLMG